MTVVYTAITNHYDTLKAPLVVDPGVRYVAFLDNNDYEVPPEWEVRRIDWEDRNPRITSRKCKLLPHRYFPDEHCSIWVDASLRIVRSLSSLVGGHDTLRAFSHPERDCIYAEAETVLSAGVAIQARIENQISQYRSEGYPERNGLFQAGFMVRQHHSPALVRANEAWWKDVTAYSQRDQVSGMVALWREGLTYEPLSGKILDYVRYIHHARVEDYREVQRG